MVTQYLYITTIISIAIGLFYTGFAIGSNRGDEKININHILPSIPFILMGIYGLIVILMRG